MITQIKTWMVTCNMCKNSQIVHGDQKPLIGISNPYKELREWTRKYYPGTSWKDRDYTHELCPDCSKKQGEKNESNLS